MKIHKNVLTQSTINAFAEELTSKFKQHCWSVSSLLWNQDLLKGIQGQSVATVLSDNLRDKIVADIQTYLPQYERIAVQGYVWGKNSGISLHDDCHFKFGATIYMNENWDIDSGGIFLWKPNDSDEYRAIVPEFNTMVINDSEERHIVTPVSPYINEFRVTIQIWGY